MLNKLLKVYKREKNINNFFKAIFSSILKQFFNVKIVKINDIETNKKAISIFNGRVLKKSKDGYYFVHPMPSEEELNLYYKYTYWSSANTFKFYGTKPRDFIHYLLIKKNLPSLFKKKKTCILNFGAGHGGISHLFWFDGFNVINIEYSNLPNFYSTRWFVYNTLDSVKTNSVDFIYGSHSLEHINNLDKFQKEIQRILKPKGFLFWEVPNGNSPYMGPRNNKIDIPHTYYFTSNFFKNWFDKTIFIKICDDPPEGVIEKWESEKIIYKEVIRALGQLN